LRSNFILSKVDFHWGLLIIIECLLIMRKTTFAKATTNYISSIKQTQCLSPHMHPMIESSYWRMGFTNASLKSLNMEVTFYLSLIGDTWSAGHNWRKLSCVYRNILVKSGLKLLPSITDNTLRNVHFFSQHGFAFLDWKIYIKESIENLKSGFSKSYNYDDAYIIGIQKSICYATIISTLFTMIHVDCNLLRSIQNVDIK